MAFLTMLRVMILIAIASVVWTPIGVYVGLQPLADPRGAAGGAISRRLPGNDLLFRWWYR